MASLNDGTIYNTQLFNKILEAMDHFTPVLFCENGGSKQLMVGIVYYNPEDGFPAVATDLGTGFSPSPNYSEDDLYVPQNITPYHYDSSDVPNVL